MPIDSNQFMARADDYQLVDDLWGGTGKMREAGETYLPRREGESLKDWKVRRDGTFLNNFFRKTVQVMAGRLFEDAVTVSDAAPAFVRFSENVDLEGRSLHRFGYDFTQKVIRDGIRFLLVDAPTAEGVRTAADERAAGIRPYFVEVDIRQALGVKQVAIGGNRVITQFRYKEEVEVEVDKWSTKTIEQIRVIEPNLVTLYRKDKKGEWALFDEIPTSIGFVPVVPVYAGRQGFLDAYPPLLDIAYLNVQHWQSSSLQSNILAYTRAPILHHAGGGSKYDETGKEVAVVVGPGSYVRDSDTSARLTYVEPQGAAIEHGWRDLQRIEEMAIALGADYASPRKSGDITATEAAISESGDVSDLSALAQNIKDSLELAMLYVGRMIGQEFTGTVTLNTDLGIMSANISIPELVKLRALGDLSREGLFEVLNRQWDTELDASREAERLEFEGGSPQRGADEF